MIRQRYLREWARVIKSSGLIAAGPTLAGGTLHGVAAMRLLRRGLRRMSANFHRRSRCSSMRHMRLGLALTLGQEQAGGGAALSGYAWPYAFAQSHRRDQRAARAQAQGPGHLAASLRGWSGQYAQAMARAAGLPATWQMTLSQLAQGMTHDPFFITSSGTGIGKTLVMTSLCWQTHQQGKHITALKPVITGYDPADENNDTRSSSKAAALRRRAR